MAITLFFVAIMVRRVILESIHYKNNVKCHRYMRCLSSSSNNDLGWMHICWKSGIRIVDGLPMRKTLFSLLCVSQS
jgi:hypothetical protein